MYRLRCRRLNGGFFIQLLFQSVLDLLSQIVVICLGHLQNRRKEGTGGCGKLRLFGGSLRRGLLCGGSALLGGSGSGEEVQYVGGFVALGIFFACSHENGSFPKYQELGKVGSYIRAISLMSRRKSRATLESGA